jgi:hypothetical protein
MDSNASNMSRSNSCRCSQRDWQSTCPKPFDKLIDHIRFSTSCLTGKKNIMSWFEKR